ncbi:MAG: pilus assembly protein TadG-related protein [Thermoguttaceae bacterium]
MSLQLLTNDAKRRGPSRRADHRRNRRGAVTILAMFLVFLLVLVTALVVNWNFLVLVNRDMQHKCDAMALAAAPELLDERLLQDAGEPLAPDLGQRQLAAAQAAADTCRRNNEAGAASLRTEWADVAVRTGFVADVARRPCHLDESASRHNTVCVLCGRLATGSHPVSYLANVAGATHAVDIRGGAYATLDNLVVGFRPIADAPSPVMPLAISRDAWRSERDTDSNGNGIREMILRLKAAQPPEDQQLPPTPNAAVLFYRGSADPGELARQVAVGILPTDLPSSGGVLGPGTPARPFLVAGTSLADGSDPLTETLKDAIQAAVGQKRAFPLYREIAPADPNAAATVALDGFVACVIMGAGVVDRRLVVRVEPCFLIHHTLWTVPPDANDPLNPERNPYLYKLRLSR